MSALSHMQTPAILGLRLKAQLGAGVEKLSKKFARIALMAANLLKLSLAAYAWAEYRTSSGAAKLHAVYSSHRPDLFPQAAQTGVT